MRRLLVVLACGLACTALYANADPIPADPEHLGVCVVNARLDYPALQRCRGAMARPCVEIEGISTMSEVLCWSEEYGAWRDMIEMLTVEIETRDAEKGARLRRANAAWAAWLEAECDYFS